MEQSEVGVTAQVVRQVQEGLAQLGRMYPRRRFTLDGHAVGSLGEVIAETLFGLTLSPPSNAGFDALDSKSRPVEIKATYGERVAFRGTSHAVSDLRVVVLNLKEPNLPGLVVFNGLYRTVQQALPAAVASNGQRQISLAKLRILDKEVPDQDRLPIVGASLLTESATKPTSYRLLTESDDARFSHRVSEALRRGYELHGAPAVTSNNGETYLAQAVIWTGPGDPPSV